MQTLDLTNFEICFIPPPSPISLIPKETFTCLCREKHQECIFHQSFGSIKSRLIVINWLIVIDWFTPSESFCSLEEFFKTKKKSILIPTLISNKQSHKARFFLRGKKTQMNQILLNFRCFIPVNISLHSGTVVVFAFNAWKELSYGNFLKCFGSKIITLEMLNL